VDIADHTTHKPMAGSAENARPTDLNLQEGSAASPAKAAIWTEPSVHPSGVQPVLRE
jgi:hypothetical protein